MAEFAYIAKNSQGQQVRGTIEAVGRREALSALTGERLFPLRVDDANKSQLLASWMQFTFSRRIKRDAIAQTLSQMSDLLSSGVPLLGAMDVLASQATNEKLGEVLQQVRGDVADGAPLEDALAKHPRVFGELVVSMVRAGSAGAFLEEALERTALFLTLQEELKSRVRGAMAYPIFLAVAGTIVTVVLIVFFVPKFASLFEKLEQQGGLPMPTVMLLWLSDFLGSYGIFVLAGLIAALVAANRYLQTPAGRHLADRFKLRVKLFGPIVQSLAIARFCRVLGTLLTNGVPLLKALHISSQSTGNVIFGEAIAASAENVTSGETLARPLTESGLFPKNIMAMISVGEQANNLDKVLINVSDRLERRTMQQLDILVRLLEPLMLLVMGALMLFVIVALLLPVFDMGSALD